MVQFNTKDNEILVKIVYYGTGLSGKTTNLQKLHEKMDPTNTTDLFSVNTMEDRTLFFDLLPLDLGYVFGNTIKLQIYTVPGQVHYDSTRRIVLSGADGVVFIADSDQNKLQDNIQSINNLYHNLQANRLNIKEVPLVMQYNKRDLPNATPVDVLERKLNFRNVPHFEATAVEGRGVLETFVETIKLTVGHIFQKYQLTKSMKNVESVLAKMESSIMANIPEDELDAAEAGRTTKTEITRKTVLKYDHAHNKEKQKESNDQLLQKAITSNMETAQLYTQLKKSQEELLKKNQELNVLNKKVEKSNADNLKMRRFLENLVNFAGEAIITFDEKWSTQNWNQAAEELFGYARSEVLGKNINIIFPEDAMRDLNRVLNYVMEGKVVRGFETRLKAKNNVIVPVNITFSPIKNSNDKIIAFTAIVRDLSFMAKIGSQLNLMQRFECVGSLLPNLTEQIHKEATLPIHLSAMLSLTSELSKKNQKNAEPCNLNTIIEEIHQLLESRLQAERVMWHAQLFPSLPNHSLNKTGVTRALLNLILNSLDSLDGKSSGKITIGTHFANSEILLQMIDNGVGMAHDEMGRVLDPMIDEQKNIKNLRMNAARDLIRESGGVIRVDSTPGKGTKVTIRFPFS